jgi:TetR/AcrR family transcriptional regulator, tetracycline repressor protein
MTDEKRTVRRRPAGSGPSRTPGQRAGLTREEVLARARATAAEEGLERVTIRRLAAQLDVAPNALYTYFPDKAALLDALFDATLGELQPPDPEQGAWRDALAELMRASRRLLLAHPHLVSLFLSRPGGPNALRLGETTLRILARGGVEGRQAVEALRALLTYTLGFAALEIPRLSDPRRAGRSEGAAALIAALPAAQLPLTRSLAAELAAHPADRDFEAGLRWLIDGIAADAGRR